MINFTVLTLCDATTVRDSLLNVLGGGITHFQRGSYPAAMGVRIASLVQVVDETADEIASEVSFSIASVDDLDNPFYRAGGNLTLKKDPTVANPLPQSVPYFGDLSDVELPAPGRYVVTATIADGASLQLHFVATEVLS